MSEIVQSSVSNRLLALMTPSDFALLSDVMQLVEFEGNSVLVEPHTPIRDVYIIEAGIVSQIAISGHLKMEAGLYGRDGFSGTALLLDVDQTPFQHFVHAAGRGLRIGACDFIEAVNRSSSLRRLLLRFAYVLGIQIGYTALCNKSTAEKARVARWILMYQDRIDGDNLTITHATIAFLMGTRRAGITDALHVLEGNHLIRSTRGQISIIDRQGLIEFSKSYGPPEAEYERLIGPMSG